MSPYKLHATKLNDYWDTPIDNFEKFVRRGPREVTHSYEGSTTEPGSLLPPHVVVKSGYAANFSRLIGKAHVNFRVEDSDGTVRMRFLGFVERVSGDHIILKSHSVW